MEAPCTSRDAIPQSNSNDEVALSRLLDQEVCLPGFCREAEPMGCVNTKKEIRYKDLLLVIMEV